MKQFKITSLGCKVNQYDGLAIAEALLRRGWTAVCPAQTPDCVIINTCCITSTAMRKSRQTIRKAVRNAPQAAVAVVGCYSTYYANKILEILLELAVPEEKILLAGHHEDLAASLERWLDGLEASDKKTPKYPNGLESAENSPPASHPSIEAGDYRTIRQRRKQALAHNTPATEHLPPIAEFPGHQRAFLKIQDGCDAFCAYCIVPYTRSRVWSKTDQQILAECMQLLNTGHKEIVLCGVFLGAYGRDTTIRRNWDNTPSPLPKLIARVADLPGIWRVRLGSLEPGDVTPEMLDVFANTPNVAPHFHLPLQSGSAEILKQMNRQYTSEEFCRTVDRLHETLNRPALTTDIIVGFPGETDEHFAETLAVARHAKFAKIHAFPFSAIEPTPAWQRRHECPPTEVVQQRMAALAELETQTATAYRQQFVGQTMEALVESTLPAEGMRRGMTDRYLTVDFPARTDKELPLTGNIVKVVVKGLSADGLISQLAL